MLKIDLSKVRELKEFYSISQIRNILLGIEEEEKKWKKVKTDEWYGKYFRVEIVWFEHVEKPGFYKVVTYAYHHLAPKSYVAIGDFYNPTVSKDDKLIIEDEKRKLEILRNDKWIYFECRDIENVEKDCAFPIGILLDHYFPASSIWKCWWIFPTLIGIVGVLAPFHGFTNPKEYLAILGGVERIGTCKIESNIESLYLGIITPPLIFLEPFKTVFMVSPTKPSKKWSIKSTIYAHGNIFTICTE